MALFTACTAQGLPDDAFEVLPSDSRDGGIRGAYPPWIRDFVWTGSAARAEFKVGCKPGALGAEARTVRCKAEIIEGSTVMQLSFRIEVVHGGVAKFEESECDLDATMERVHADVAKIMADDLTVEEELGHGIQVSSKDSQPLLCVQSCVDRTGDDCGSWVIY